MENNNIENNKIITEIYENSDENKNLGYTAICNYIKNFDVNYNVNYNVNFTLNFVKKHNSVPENEIDALDPYYEEGKHVWKFYINDIDIEFNWEESVPYSFGNVILKYPENIDKMNLENVRRNVIEFFCCPCYGCKNYDEYITKYGIGYQKSSI